MSDTMEITLPCGMAVSLPVVRPFFRPWRGAAVAFSYGNKPVLEYDGEPCFAELAVMHDLRKAGWDAVWISTYAGLRYRQSMPRSRGELSDAAIPPDHETLLHSIWQVGRTRACFDVFAWRDGRVAFHEAKRRGKDRLRVSQLRFIARSPVGLPRHPWSLSNGAFYRRRDDTASDNAYPIRRAARPSGRCIVIWVALA
jgi:hypothetical protein